MTENQQASPPPKSRWTRLFIGRVILAALALGVAIGAGVALLHRPAQGSPAAVSTIPAKPAATWPAGSKRAPDFRLVDAAGAPVSLSSFRGRPAIVTFIDPVCTSLCPLEAKELNDAVAALPKAKRPVIIAVSVNPWANSRANFRRDAKKWHLIPEWHWAAGPRAQLAPVWKRYYIGVIDKPRTIAGKLVHNIVHTEASYVVDPAGYERALFLYPFLGRDVAAVVSRVSSKA
jgi:cytochrome oxidase Cu insertion factor (SCO1/SenC/PrrC family)